MSASGIGPMSFAGWLPSSNTKSSSSSIRTTTWTPCGSYLAEFPEINRERVLLMPQGTDAGAARSATVWLKPFCEAEGLVFCPRKQIEWFGPVRGT